MSGYIFKAADAPQDIQVDWRQGYLDESEYLDADLGWTVTPVCGEGDPVILSQTFDDGASVARIGGGVPGRIYMLAAQAKTNTGRPLERSVVLQIAS